MPANLWLFILKKKVIKPTRDSICRGWEGVCLHVGMFDVWWSGESWSFHRKSPQISEMRGLIFWALQFLRRNICISFLKGPSPGCQYSGGGWEGRYITPVLVAAWCTSVSVSPAGVVITCLQGVEWGPEDLTTPNAHIHSAPASHLSFSFGIPRPLSSTSLWWSMASPRPRGCWEFIG